MQIPSDAASLWRPRMVPIMSRWFVSYDEARASLDAEGGYLLPHGSQYFVTSREAIRELGVSPDDPDWERIGFDWVRPADPAARDRLADRVAPA